MVSSAENDILDPEALGSSAPLGWSVGVLTHSKQVVEGNVDQISRGAVLWCRTAESLLYNEVGDGDWNRELGLGGWILPTVGLYLLFEGWPVGGPALVLVRGAGLVSQLEGLGEGCQRLLNSLSANAIF